MLPIKEGLNKVGHAFHVQAHGYRAYKGSARQICDKIIQDCWNGKYFQTSAGHFNEFWTRDFGWCVDSLLKLGYRKEVLKTLAYALRVFSSAGTVKTTILPNGKPYDFFRFAPDSLPFLMHALNSARAKNLIRKYRSFLQKEVVKYNKKVIDPTTGIVRKERFSSMRDGVYRNRSAYDTAMVGMLAKELDRAGIKHKLPDIKKVLLKKYWNDSYFLDDLSGRTHVTGDAQVFPFWTNVINDKNMMRKAFQTVRTAGLDKPFPLKYVPHFVRADELTQRIFVPNYEGSTIWAHMGLLYIQLLQKVDKARAKAHIKKYKDLVEHYKTFIEVYQPDGKRPYQSFFYVADEAMLWAANLRVLL